MTNAEIEKRQDELVEMLTRVACSQTMTRAERNLELARLMDRIVRLDAQWEEPASVR